MFIGTAINFMKRSRGAQWFPAVSMRDGSAPGAKRIFWGLRSINI